MVDPSPILLDGPTHFASAARATSEAVREEARIFRTQGLLRQMLDGLGVMVLLLNEHRQIVFANRALCQALGRNDDTAMLGLRPGEALQCRHALAEPCGCGTAEVCQHCGAVRGILLGLRGLFNEQECRIETVAQAHFDFRVVCQPVSWEGRSYVLFTITDIGDEKRRQFLERLFLHDLLNTASGIRGLAELLRHTPSEQQPHLFNLLDQATEVLLDEVYGHRDLVRAEAGDLVAEEQTVEIRQLLRHLVDFYGFHPVAYQKRIRLAEPCPDQFVQSDSRLLRRVLGNMLKNALEASEAGAEVTIGCAAQNGRCAFLVHNHTAIPAEVQRQIFQRSFSTKGPGRGLGTYSMKLLAEKYLGAEVSFQSGPSAGTTFFLTLAPTRE